MSEEDQVEGNRRRVRRVLIQHRFWEQMFTSGARPALRVKGIPEGSEVIFQEWCPEYAGFSIYVRHESFDEVPDGEEVPVMHIEAQEIRDAEGS